MMCVTIHGEITSQYARLLIVAFSMRSQVDDRCWIWRASSVRRSEVSEGEGKSMRTQKWRAHISCGQTGNLLPLQLVITTDRREIVLERNHHLYVGLVCRSGNLPPTALLRRVCPPQTHTLPRGTWHLPRFLPPCFRFDRRTHQQTIRCRCVTMAAAARVVG
jgi:hypothetical protein